MVGVLGEASGRAPVVLPPHPVDARASISRRGATRRKTGRRVAGRALTDAAAPSSRPRRRAHPQARARTRALGLSSPGPRRTGHGTQQGVRPERGQGGTHGAEGRDQRQVEAEVHDERRRRHDHRELEAVRAGELRERDPAGREGDDRGEEDDERPDCAGEGWPVDDGDQPRGNHGGNRDRGRSRARSSRASGGRPAKRPRVRRPVRGRGAMPARQKQSPGSVPLSDRRRRRRRRRQRVPAGRAGRCPPVDAGGPRSRRDRSAARCARSGAGSPDPADRPPAPRAAAGRRRRSRPPGRALPSRSRSLRSSPPPSSPSARYPIPATANTPNDRNAPTSARPSARARLS